MNTPCGSRTLNTMLSGHAFAVPNEAAHSPRRANALFRVVLHGFAVVSAGRYVRSIACRGCRGPGWGSTRRTVTARARGWEGWEGKAGGPSSRSRRIVTLVHSAAPRPGRPDPLLYWPGTRMVHSLDGEDWNRDRGPRHRDGAYSRTGA